MLMGSIKLSSDPERIQGFNLEFIRQHPWASSPSVQLKLGEALAVSSRTVVMMFSANPVMT